MAVQEGRMELGGRTRRVHSCECLPVSAFQFCGLANLAFCPGAESGTGQTGQKAKGNAKGIESCSLCLVIVNWK